MKLAKLSLAAIMAAGALSYANAGSLEDAIKGVNINGFLRYRYYNESDIAAKTDRHRFSGSVQLTMPVADNLSAAAVMEYEDSDYAANSGEASTDVSVQQLWFKYKTADYSLKVGKQALNTPITYNYYSPRTGDGALFMFTGVKGWTFAAAAFVNTSYGYIDANNIPGDGEYVLDADTGVPVPGDAEYDLGQENVYVAAAIGSVGPVNLQLWGFKITNVIDDEEFLQVDGKMAGFCYKAQYATTNLTDPDSDRQAYYAIKLGYSMDGMGVNAGYLGTSTDGGYVDLDAGDGTGFIYGGINSQYAYANKADTSIAFINLSGSFGKTSVGAGYAGGSFGLDADAKDISEWYVKAGYAYSKNFNVSAYYSDLGQDFENNEFRFEAKYSF